MKGRKPNLKIMTQDGLEMAPACTVPAWLPPLAAAEWLRVAPGLVARGLLTDDTSGTVESYCVCAGFVRQHSETLARDGAIIETDDGPVAHPANRLLLAAQREARLLAGELGITPHRYAAGVVKALDELSDLDL